MVADLILWKKILCTAKEPIDKKTKQIKDTTIDINQRLKKISRHM